MEKHTVMLKRWICRMRWTLYPTMNIPILWIKYIPMIIKNLTWHFISIEWKEFKPQWNIRLSQTIEIIGDIDGISIVKSSFWKWEIPQQEDWTILIVSHIVCQQNPTRDDLYIIGWKTMDSNNVVNGASYLVINPYYDNTTR